MEAGLFIQWKNARCDFSISSPTSSLQLPFPTCLASRSKIRLCGTKVISRRNYLRLAKHRSYFGEFDPFGDFDLIFGAARMGLRTVEIPIVYGERTYGETNISRWRHGVLLIAMLMFAARRLKFI